MKILVLILGIVVCCVTCTSKRLNRQVVVNNDQVFFDDWDASRSALDLYFGCRMMDFCSEPKTNTPSFKK